MAEQQTEVKQVEQQQVEVQTGVNDFHPITSQDQLEKVIGRRIHQERAKYADYPDLLKKVQDYEKQQEQLSQQEMEKKQEYEKLKEGWTNKETEYQKMLNDSRLQLQQERITNALSNEILKKNAYPEAAQLLKSQAKYNEDGSITISGRDANGMTTDLPIDKGVEQFLNERPYLVKGSNQGGGGTSSSVGGGQASQADIDLAGQLQHAMAVGDRKAVQEIKQKIKIKHASAGISSIL